MLDGQRGQMGIGDEVGSSARMRKQAREGGAVVVGRLRNPGIGAIESRSYLSPRGAEGIGLFEHARIGHDPQKPKDAGPWYAHTGRLIQAGV